ncbi:MAG: hypothetical protein KME26_12055 [Oscillatoria princeps RMCB-10]|nr:hypothetical protein [Oscillatoria princeps RMCB-10]
MINQSDTLSGPGEGGLGSAGERLSARRMNTGTRGRRNPCKRDVVLVLRTLPARRLLTGAKS